MQSYIENFNYKYQLLPIKEINENKIIFYTNELPEEFYSNKIRESIVMQLDFPLPNDEKILEFLYSDNPTYNEFDLLKTFGKEKLYIEFSNLLNPKNKKEKLNKVKNIKNFITAFGYIYKFDYNELIANETIYRPLAEIETEIKIFNAIINMQYILNSGVEIGKEIDNIKYFDIILKEFPELNILSLYNYNFKDTIMVENTTMQKEISNILTSCISHIVNFKIKNCNINIFFDDFTPKTVFECKSLLEVMYIQFLLDTTKSNLKYGICEYCGKYVLLDEKDLNKKHIYCKITKEEKDTFNLNRSPCASRAATAKYRDKKKR